MEDELLRFLTIQQVAEMLHMSVRAIQDKVKHGDIKAYKPAKKMLFKVEDVEKWVKRFPAA